ncbi:MAG: outer membrane lipoprotein-sorting protein [bacterium]
MKTFCAMIVLLLAAPVSAQTPTGDEILKKLDENVRARNRVLTSKMTIHGRRGSRTLASKSWIKGTEKSFTEYLAPAREKGTKMLKLEDQLWTYSPSTDRTIKIAGHMLRQSVMGSDLSYEDFMEDQQLHEAYSSTVIAEENYSERPCWVLELRAAQKDVAYFSRKIWVDTERYIPLREERFAKSGKLLKTTHIKDVIQVGDRWVAKHVVFKDVLKKGDGTEFVIESVEYDVDIPNHIFTKAALRK